MNKAELKALLETLIERWEHEIVEFKHASRDYSTDRIGKYFSALANEANLRNADKAWLVFGVANDTRRVLGSDFRRSANAQNELKMQVSENTEPSITFHNIYELDHQKGRVVFLEIPPAPVGMPIAWKGHYYARAGESLTSLGMDKLDRIRQQVIDEDWSAKIVSEASFDHLDEEAVSKARESFSTKYANRFSSEDISGWPLGTFLERARLVRDGQLTRSTLLLLGKPESAHLLLPYPAELTWSLKGEERAYEHFGPPFMLNTTKLYNKIGNLLTNLRRAGRIHNTGSRKASKWKLVEKMQNKNICLQNKLQNKQK